MKKVDFPTFFWFWAKRQKWTVPDIHWRAIHWLQEKDNLAVLRCFRGFGKSTILAVYNAWRYYKDPQFRILHQSESDSTAYKTSRDTLNVLRHHPLTGGLIAKNMGRVEQWWVEGAEDLRNASMYARGILSNITSSRCDEAQNDDVEVPRNIASPEAREKLRFRLEEQTHCMVPGGSQLFIGTPHTHDSLYDELEAMGADCLTIRLFEDAFRIEENDATELEYETPFRPVHVFSGVYKSAKLLVEGVDYELTETGIRFASPPNQLIDCYGESSWPERFTIAELKERRSKTRTINAWDSQYQLHSKPVTETRLNPDRMREYDVEPVVRIANKTVEMYLGNVKVAGMVAYWDVATGKIKGDASAFSLVLTDTKGHLYWHVCQALTGDLATFDGDNQITGGQVIQIRDLVSRYNIPRVVVEVNGPGSFAGKLLRTVLKGFGCGVIEHYSVANKQKRILDAFEAPLGSQFLWAHSRVLDGPVYDQMRDFNPEVTTAPDDFIDSGAGAISQTPVRIGQRVVLEKNDPRRQWQPSDGTHEVELVF